MYTMDVKNIKRRIKTLMCGIYCPINDIPVEIYIEYSTEIEYLSSLIRDGEEFCNFVHKTFCSGYYKNQIYKHRN